MATELEHGLGISAMIYPHNESGLLTDPVDDLILGIRPNEDADGDGHEFSLNALLNDFVESHRLAREQGGGSELNWIANYFENCAARLRSAE